MTLKTEGPSSWLDHYVLLFSAHLSICVRVCGRWEHGVTTWHPHHGSTVPGRVVSPHCAARRCAWSWAGIPRKVWHLGAWCLADDAASSELRSAVHFWRGERACPRAWGSEERLGLRDWSARLHASADTRGGLVCSAGGSELPRQTCERAGVRAENGQHSASCSCGWIRARCLDRTCPWHTTRRFP